MEQGRRVRGWQVAVAVVQGPWVQVSIIFEVGLVQRQAVWGCVHCEPPFPQEIAARGWQETGVRGEGFASGGQVAGEVQREVMAAAG